MNTNNSPSVGGQQQYWFVEQERLAGKLRLPEIIGFIQIEKHLACEDCKEI